MLIIVKEYLWKNLYRRLILDKFEHKIKQYFLNEVNI
jgi:hypothetical protein